MKTNIAKQGFTLIELLVVITIIAILASLAVPTFSKIQEKGNMTKGINNCRQIVTTLKLYASDNGGNYPDTAAAGSTDSNTVFLQMFISGAATDEKIFGCPASVNGNPDGDIGVSPGYVEAVKAGENHWAMSSGLNDSASGGIPVVYEGPVAGGAFNPTWNTGAAGRSVQGRTWSGGKVIIGLNDGSVSTQNCNLNGGGTLKPVGTSASNIFEQVTAGLGGSAGAPTVLLPKTGGGAGTTGGATGN